MIEVRYLTLADLPAILALAPRAAAEVPSWGVIDEGVIKASLTVMFASPFYFIKGVFVDGELMGGMICYITQNWFNTVHNAHGITIWLDKRLRGKGYGPQLYKDFFAWCERYDHCHSINMQTTSGVDLTSMFTKFGFTKVGSTYRKEIERCVL